MFIIYMYWRILSELEMTEINSEKMIFVQKVWWVLFHYTSLSSNFVHAGFVMQGCKDLAIARVTRFAE